LRLIASLRRINGTRIGIAKLPTWSSRSEHPQAIENRSVESQPTP
jgi:hypothetical protein